MPKKIAVIGLGTAGVLSALHFYRWAEGCEVELYYDSNIKPQPVGEGSTVLLPRDLWNNMEFSFQDLESIDGTAKFGIKKTGWNGNDFIHTFFPPRVGYHFNAGKLQQLIVEKLKPVIKVIDKNVKHDDIDADYVIDCSGKPQSYDDFTMSEYIAVNSVHVTQCYWDHARFNHTLTLARPYGWVFGIPLRNRCSIGYMYNNTINTLDEVKVDVKNIFKEYDLTPSTDTNSFSFKNYYRKSNFGERVVYNGNSSFFLEPMEATSIATMDFINRGAWDVWFQSANVDSVNRKYTQFLQETETMIMLHYYAGSKFDTPFWDFAKDRGEKNIQMALKNQKFVDMIADSLKSKEYLHSESGQGGYYHYGGWTPLSYNQNLENLNLYGKLEKENAKT
jgi:tryptophan halogenase